MSARFIVLASGSSGNASYLDIDGQGVVVDFGVGPRQLTRLLDLAQVAWDNVRAVMLTHLHSDHWNEPTLKLLARSGVPLWCHADHAAEMSRRSDAFHDLERAGLVHHYQASRTFDLGPCTCTPLPLWHDVVTFGFRFDGTTEPWALGYAADLGTWAGDLVDRLAEVDVLAIEFNHDVQMERKSRRHESLIERVLGDEGHLSNDQACELLAEIFRRTSSGRLRHVVPLHLSQQCNRPKIVHAAIDALRSKLQAEFTIHPAKPACPTPWFSLSSAAPYRLADAIVKDYAFELF